VMYCATAIIVYTRVCEHTPLNLTHTCHTHTHTHTCASYPSEVHDFEDPDGQGQVDNHGDEKEEDEEVQASLPPAVDSHCRVNLGAAHRRPPLVERVGLRREDILLLGHLKGTRTSDLLVLFLLSSFVVVVVVVALVVAVVVVVGGSSSGTSSGSSGISSGSSSGSRWQ